MADYKISELHSEIPSANTHIFLYANTALNENYYVDFISLKNKILSYVTTDISNNSSGITTLQNDKISKDGSVAMTAALTLHPVVSNGTDATTKEYVDTKVIGYLLLSGGTMTGYLTLSGNPTSNLHAATKAYVDSAVAALVIPSDTDDLSEGSTNLYYTNSRARASLSANAPLVYTAASGLIEIHKASSTTSGYLDYVDFKAFDDHKDSIVQHSKMIVTGIFEIASGVNDTAGTYNISGSNITIPDDCIVTNTYFEVLTAFGDDATDDSTMSIGIETTIDAKAAEKINAGTFDNPDFYNGLQTGSAEYFVVTTASRVPTITIAMGGAATKLTGGKLKLYMEYTYY